MKHFVALLLVSLAIASCSQNEPTPSGTTPQSSETAPAAETQTIQLSVEGEIYEDDLRAMFISFDRDGNDLPRINLESLKSPDGKVHVYCVIRGEGGGVAPHIAYMTIPFELDGRRLYINQYELALPTGVAYDNVNGRKWYITGCIGGELDTNSGKLLMQKTISENNLKSGGDSPLTIPLMFPWTEITFPISPLRGAVPKVHFAPRGSLLRVSTVNDTGEDLFSVGAYVKSNTFGSEGYFTFTGDITPGAYPSYTFNDDEGGFTLFTLTSLRPGESSGSYFCWVMPSDTPVAEPKTYAISSYLYSPVASDLSKAVTLTQGKLMKGGALVDYTSGIPAQGKSYSLNIHVLRTPLLIDHFLDHRLLTATHPRQIPPQESQRFPNGDFFRDLPIPVGYHIPTLDEWMAIGPSREQDIIAFDTPSTESTREVVTTHLGTHTYSAVYTNTPTATYAIRFAMLSSSPGTETAPAANNNFLRCAYRYTYDQTSGSLSVCVRHIGQNNMELADIANESFWQAHDPLERKLDLVPSIGEAEVITVTGSDGVTPYYHLNANATSHAFWARDGKVSASPQGFNSSMDLMSAFGGYSALPIIIIKDY